METTPTNPRFITAYGPKVKQQLICEPGFGRTKQSFKDECDINNILKRFQKTGVLDFVNKHAAQYGDVIGADFQSAMNIIAQANSMFADLPAHLRTRFENDPAQFLDFVADEKNRPEALELGLLKQPAPEPVVEAPTEPVAAPAAAPQPSTAPAAA